MEAVAGERNSPEPSGIKAVNGWSSSPEPPAETDGGPAGAETSGWGEVGWSWAGHKASSGRSSGCSKRKSFAGLLSSLEPSADDRRG